MECVALRCVCQLGATMVLHFIQVDPWKDPSCFFHEPLRESKNVENCLRYCPSKLPMKTTIFIKIQLFLTNKIFRLLWKVTLKCYISANFQHFLTLSTVHERRRMDLSNATFHINSTWIECSMVRNEFSISKSVIKRFGPEVVFSI